MFLVKNHSWTVTTLSIITLSLPQKLTIQMATALSIITSIIYLLFICNWISFAHHVNKKIEYVFIFYNTIALQIIVRSKAFFLWIMIWTKHILYYTIYIIIISIRYFIRCFACMNEKRSFRRKTIRFDTAVDLMKCLKQIK